MKPPALLLLALGMVPTLVGAAGRAVPVNVLLITVDDLKPALGCYGDTLARTPHIDRLAARGTVFLNAHCQQAVCGPSRTSALTGLRPDTLGITRFGIDMRQARPGLVTLPGFFKQHGYESVGLGKIFDGRNSDGWDTQDRASWTRRIDLHPFLGHLTFDYGAEATRTRIEALLPAARAAGYGNDRERILKEAGAKPSSERLEVSDTVYEDGVMAREAAALLRDFARTRRPFFLAVGFKKPHLPFAAPARYWNLHDPARLPAGFGTSLPDASPAFAGHTLGELRAYTDIPPTGPVPQAKLRALVHGYYASVSYIDAQVGLLLESLHSSGLAGHTLVVLWGDHGFHLGDHGLFGKHTNYEHATRTPLLLAGPGVAAGHEPRPVELLGLLPTLARRAGLEPPPGLDGSDLLTPDLLPPVAASQFPRATDDGRAVMGYAFRDLRHRYVAWFDTNTRAVVAEEFFDYQTDPDESRNLAAVPAARQALDHLRGLARQARPDLFP